MTQQLPLDGFTAPSKPTDRLFFAFFPDPFTAERIARLALKLRGEHALKGRVLATDRFHVTLHHLGDFAGLPPDVLSRARDVAAAMAMPPFEINFGRAASFANRSANHPFVLLGDEGNAELMDFQRRLGVGLQRSGLRFDAKFTPHVTLVYDGSRVAEQPVERIGWVANELVLVHSLLGRTRHLRLGEWSLGS